MTINANTIDVEGKDGDDSTFPLPVRAIGVRQSDGTVKDVTATDPMPTSEASASAMAADITQLNAFTAYGKTIADMETIPISITGAGVGTLHADTEGKKFLLMGLQGTMDGAGTYQFREADDAPVYSGAMEAAEAGGICMPVTGFPYITTADDKGLEVVTVGDGLKGMAQILEVDN